MIDRHIDPVPHTKGPGGTKGAGPIAGACPPRCGGRTRFGSPLGVCRQLYGGRAVKWGAAHFAACPAAPARDPPPRVLCVEPTRGKGAEPGYDGRLRRCASISRPPEGSLTTGEAAANATRGREAVPTVHVDVRTVDRARRW
eukprot:gene23094-59628_t